MRKWLVLVCSILAFAPPGAYAAEAAIAQVPQAKMVGKGRLSLLFWEVYDAALYAPQGQWREEAPMALVIHYFREIEGKDIADRTIREMRQQGFAEEDVLAGWLQALRKIFPDVRRGSELTGVYVPGKATRFYLDDREIGQVKDPAFGPRFFNIWLAENTSEPGLRQQLLGKP